MPAIAFSPSVSSTLTLASKSWNTSRTICTSVYNVVNAGVSLSSVQATVSGAMSSAGNPQVPFVVNDAFAINTTRVNGPNISVTANNTGASVNSQDFGESFVATASGPLTQLNVLNIVDMYNAQDQSVASTGATLEIYQGGINTTNPNLASYDTPAGALLYVQNVTFTAGNNNIVLTAPVNLVSGQTYLWKLVPSGVSTISTRLATNNPYLQGDTLAGPGLGYDLDFQIFI
jgi:hypothetical protein